ncbi:MAG: COX15/CtaA family protein [Bdellovibrionales bacterium]|nr:COX15/CtaA family protein [Bdellovibrionales bacterium]
MSETASTKIFFQITRFLVWYTILVIIWGAWVRISHSGDGCGTHWPLCQGVLLPKSVEPKVLIEFSHRVMSGVYGVVILLLFLWGRTLFPSGHMARKLLLATLVFTVLEALIGAKLVLLELVGDNDSLWRAGVMGIHLLNTFLLLASTVALSRSRELMSLPKGNSFGIRRVPKQLLSAGSILLVVALAGAWASLSNTLFPSHSLLSGLEQDLAADQPVLFQLRIVHPLLAVIGSVALVALTYNLQHARSFLRMLSLQVFFGFFTLLHLSPVWMKLSHLFLADLVWVTFVEMVIRSCSENVEQAKQSGGFASAHPDCI